MRPCHSSPYRLLVPFFNLGLVRAGDPLSIQSEPVFTTQRGCIRDCLYCGEYVNLNCDYTPLAEAIGCWDDQYDNCYCATDLQSSASSFLTKCINSACSGDQADLTTALSLYNGYCGIGTWTLGSSYVPVESVTLQSQPAFMTQRDCVRECLFCNEYYNLNCAFTALNEAIGCWDAWYDSCYCAKDLQSSASSFITRCINSACSGNAQVPVAMSIYNGYCGVGTWTLSNWPAATSAASSSLHSESYRSSDPAVPGSSSWDLIPGATRTPGPRPTGPSSRDHSGSGSGLDPGTIVGIITAIISFIALVFGAWWKIRESKKARRRAR